MPAGYAVCAQPTHDLQHSHFLDSGLMLGNLSLPAVAVGHFLPTKSVNDRQRKSEKTNLQPSRTSLHFSETKTAAPSTLRREIRRGLFIFCFSMRHVRGSARTRAIEFRKLSEGNVFLLRLSLLGGNLLLLTIPLLRNVLFASTFSSTPPDPAEA